MSIFINQDYQALASDLIKDSFYADNSYGGKIQAERRCAELIVRKILDLPVTEKVTLGKHPILNQIATLPHHEFLENAISALKPFGDTNSHTGDPIPPTQAEYEKVTDSLFDILAYLPIRYFDKYKFGSNRQVLRSFSMLPPIIRIKVLEFLYSVDPKNLSVIDKLTLALLKDRGINEAEAWIEDHKAELELLKAVSEDAYKDIIEKQGEIIAKAILEAAPENMYTCCLENIGRVQNKLNEEGIIYKTFEEALPYYKEHRDELDDSKNEEKEFKDMMDFLYLGRKTDGTQELRDSILVIDMI